jgi:diaminopimelate epimerase
LIPFTKAHACGNDFLVVTEDDATGFNWAELARTLCSRTTGVGADGVEFFAWTGPKSGRIWLNNSDGSIAEISGNGTRCVAAWMAQSLGSQPGEVLEIATDAGPRMCLINSLSTTKGFSVEVTTGMGVPVFAPRTVVLRSIRRIVGIEVFTGNPHFVIVVDNADFEVFGEPWHIVGAEVCGHADFPHQTNVEFVHVLSPDLIEIRIFERGAGPTSSSGTGSSAAAIASRAFMGCLSPLTVLAPGGAQIVDWEGAGAELRLTGTASLIARGEAFCA